MTFIYFLLLIWTLTEVQSAVFPTKDQICGNPKFEGGFAISDLKDDSVIHRYLFQDQYIMEYIREDSRQEIDWKSIALINQTFLGRPPSIKGVQYAFQYNKHQVCIRFKGEKELYIFDRTNSGFFVNRTIKVQEVVYQLLYWKLTTKLQSSNQLIGRYYFIDSSSKPHSNPVSTNVNMSYSNEQEHILFMTINVPKMNEKILKLEALIFPGSMIFINNRGNRIIIPTEFDAYYQVRDKETIFFKGESACITMANKQTLPREAEYCRRFVDTRTIIGCTSKYVYTNSVGPETDPNEEDIELDF